MLLRDPFAFANPFFFNPNPFFFSNFYGYLPYAYGYYPASLLYGLYGGAYGGYGNPYGGYGYGGYGYGDAGLYAGANPYAGGNSYGFVNPYGMNPYVANPNGANATAYGASGASAVQNGGNGAAARSATVLAAAGVPASGAGLDWPLALRILPGADPLRNRIDALYQVAAGQAATGSMNAGLPLEMYRSVEKLEKLVQSNKNERMTLSSAMYAEAERFLRRLKQAAREVGTLAQAASPSTPTPFTAGYSQQSR
jgi:hypothetical protein